MNNVQPSPFLGLNSGPQSFFPSPAVLGGMTHFLQSSRSGDTVVILKLHCEKALQVITVDSEVGVSWSDGIVPLPDS